MNEVFTVYLARNDIAGEAHAMLELPALPYALRDAMDKVRLREGDELFVQIESYHCCGFLSALPLKAPDLHGLNILAGKLSELGAQELKKFEGLVKISVGDGNEALSVESLIEIASSTPSATLIPVSSDEELGKYFVKSGMIPALKDLPETAWDMLDYDKIGFVRRNLEGGVFLDDGRSYVMKSYELQPLYSQIDYMLEEPDYTVMLRANVLNHEEPLLLKLPASLAEIDAALDHSPAVSWECVDCSVPALCKLLSEAESLDIVCETAAVLETIPEKNLPKYKALLEAEGFYSLGEALSLIDHLDEYLLSPQYSTPEEIAVDNLCMTLDERERETLLPFVDLHAYGQKLLEEQETILTDYGAFERCDSQPLQRQTEENTPSQGGMEMEGF